MALVTQVAFIFNLKWYNRRMFFNPIDFYLKALLTTLIVEGMLFIILISKKPLKLAAALIFNLLSNVLLHVYFHYAVVYALGSKLFIWIIGEVLVILLEAFLFYISKILSAKQAIIVSVIFNLCSILIGSLISAVFF